MVRRTKPAAGAPSPRMIRTKYPEPEPTHDHGVIEGEKARAWTQAQVAFAIRQTGGNLTRAAALLKRATGRGNPNASTIHTYTERDPYLRSILHETREYMTDMAEDVVVSRIKDDLSTEQFQAAKFWLLTIGKSRGFSTRNEVTGKDGDPVEVSPVPKLDMTKYSEEELLQLERLLAKGSRQDSDERNSISHHHLTNGHATNGAG